MGGMWWPTHGQQLRTMRMNMANTPTTPALTSSLHRSKGLLLALCIATLVIGRPAYANEPSPKKVLIIGIDGCVPDGLLAARVPHLRDLIKNGAFSDKAQTGDTT